VLVLTILLDRLLFRPLQRAEVYRQMDEMRKSALAERTETLAQTRAQAEAEIASASARLQAETEEARRRLAADAEALGVEAAERILGRRAS
jgi:F0F1-type ATP synthase membrane subunit b/b'